MLDSTDGVVNFWMGKVRIACRHIFLRNSHPQGSYDELYGAIVKRQRVGCFQCSVVYGVVLVHLASPYAENLVYHPPHPSFLGPVDGVQQFAFSAQQEGQGLITEPLFYTSRLVVGVGMNIVNTEFFGYIMPNNKYNNINESKEDFYKFKIHILGKRTLAVAIPLDMYSLCAGRGHALVYSHYMQQKRPHIRNAALGVDTVGYTISNTLVVLLEYKTDLCITTSF